MLKTSRDGGQIRGRPRAPGRVRSRSTSLRPLTFVGQGGATGGRGPRRRAGRRPRPGPPTPRVPGPVGRPRGCRWGRSPRRGQEGPSWISESRSSRPRSGRESKSIRMTGQLELFEARTKFADRPRLRPNDRDFGESRAQLPGPSAEPLVDDDRLLGHRERSTLRNGFVLPTGQSPILATHNARGEWLDDTPGSFLEDRVRSRL